MPSCKSCEAPIIWAKTQAGKTMPLDEQPDPTGDFVYVAGVARRWAPDDARLHRQRYTSHFATCAFAAQHRSPR